MIDGKASVGNSHIRRVTAPWLGAFGVAMVLACSLDSGNQSCSLQDWIPSGVQDASGPASDEASTNDSALASIGDPAFGSVDDVPISCSKLRKLTLNLDQLMQAGQLRRPFSSLEHDTGT